MAIRDEEYAILAFGMEWIVSDYLKRKPERFPPKVYFIEGGPELGAGNEDLVYWWHRSIEKFANLRNEARINLLQVSEEKERFERMRFREIGLEIGTLDHNSLPRIEKWEFTLSRVGLDPRGRQAVAHFWATPECNMHLSFGTVLVIGWEEEDGTLEVLDCVRRGE